MTMTHTTNRRAVLGAALAVGPAVLVSVIPAIAKPPVEADHPDAGLLALGPEIEAIVRRESEAIAVLTAAEDAFLEAEPGEPIEPKSAFSPDVNELIFQDIKDGKFKHQPVDLTLYPRSPEYMAYLAAHEAWRGEVEALRRDLGIDDAKTATDEASRAWIEIRDRARDMRATALDGLIFKARHFGEDPDSMDSIVADLLALGEEARS